MKHPNYSRSAAMQFLNTLASDKASFLSDSAREHLKLLISLHKKAQKFILPDGGAVGNDPDFRAIDPSLALRLPFPVIALEHENTDAWYGKKDPGKWYPSKEIIYATETFYGAVIHVVLWDDRLRAWMPIPGILIPGSDYMFVDPDSGKPAFKVQTHPSNNIDLDDYQQEVATLFSFLNILQCSNVEIEKSEASKIKQIKAKEKRGAIPFDSYHFLTIGSERSRNGVSAGGSKRSPREHLRRGHIRRLQDGRRIWINATVVAAGSLGRIHKDYQVHHAGRA